ncbi:Ctr copper transporter [Flagelloscypha sp. PMI_526]|nr:Ctr copper transporter [Flagelloscypha sp. PMI_526]
MKMYLHFTKGDTLLFKSIVPTKPGAIFGACLVIFIIAIGGRWISSVARGVNQRGILSIMVKGMRLRMSLLPPPDLYARQPSSHAPSNYATQILSNELARSTLLGLETTIHYLLMLIVMTFNVSYIISSILGSVVGELIFGRFNRGTPAAK